MARPESGNGAVGAEAGTELIPQPAADATDVGEADARAGDAPEISAVDEAVRAEYRERFALVMTNWGLQRMVARVWAALIVTDSPTMTMPELGETLQASAGAISGAVKTLTSIGLVERVPAPGSRRDHYRIADNGWYRAMLEKNQQLIRGMIDLSGDGVEKVGRDSVAGHRLAEMHDFYSFISAEVPTLLSHWEKARDARRAAREETA